MSPEPTNAPVITFLSDYGLADDFVGVCHGVIATICPQAHVIDITHGVPRHDVRTGALKLREALRHMPAGVHIAVVDPDVGAERRAVALRLRDGRGLIGPDNGLLSPAAQEGGGVLEALDIAHSPYRLEPVSATFHGRDLFAPVAAHLAAGVPFAQLGQPCEPDGLVGLELSRAQREGEALLAHVQYIDRFGNLQLDASHEELAGTGLKLGRAVELECSGTTHSAHYVRTFADVTAGDLLVYEDASRTLAVALSHGDAARRLGISVADELRIRPA